MSMTLTSSRPLRVYYDGGCPICSREIAFYRARPGADGFEWIDVTRAGPDDLGADLTREAALARMHVRLPDGTLASGAAAFAAMWRRMPGRAMAPLRWLGHVLAVPPFGALGELGYRGFLIARKAWR
jgi:predicted DCC family thiol-disulfide oxidoreductase YuxK